MITLNLLPDIKKEYLKANRTKSLLLTIAFMVSISAIGVVALMAIYTYGVQRIQIASSQSSIDSSVNAINEIEDLDKIVTVQNQLSALPGLQDETVVTSRIFDFLRVLTPADVKLSSVSVNYDDDQIEMKGVAKDVKTINTFVDALKLSTYIYSDNETSQNAFSDVVLDAIGTDLGESAFTIVFKYNPEIFNPNVEGLKLTVPEIISTRSQLEKPSSLFDSSEPEGQQ